MDLKIIVKLIISIPKNQVFAFGLISSRNPYAINKIGKNIEIIPEL